MEVQSPIDFTVCRHGVAQAGCTAVTPPNQDSLQVTKPPIDYQRWAVRTGSCAESRLRKTVVSEELGRLIDYSDHQAEQVDVIARIQLVKQARAMR